MKVWSCNCTSRTAYPSPGVVSNRALALRAAAITLLGGAAVAWPLAARAQQSAMPVVGFLHVAFPGPYTQHLIAFRQGLKQSGYVEGQNVAIEYRWAYNEPGRLPELAADLVSRQVALIVAVGGPPSALAAKAATSTIPIVLVFGSDPVRLGLVASLNRPGGNITGVTFLTTELVAKRLELLHELIPQATTVAYLGDLQIVVGQEMLRDTLAAASVTGLQIAVVEARSDRDFESAFATLVERQAGAVIVGPSQLFDSNRDQLLALAARHKMPAIYQARKYVLDGGLMSYGANQVDAFRVGGLYVGQILKGGKPANLPVQQATKIELVINLRTAKALGLELPLSLMIRADELME
jgi:putative ABC transport system substrate-binding protein